MKECGSKLLVAARLFDLPGNGKKSVRPRVKTKIWSQIGQPLPGQLTQTTTRSAGVDLATAQSVALTDSTVTLISTGVMSLLGTGVAPSVRMSFCYTDGTFVLPGVTDADYTEEIKIMAWMPFPLLYSQRLENSTISPFSFCG